MNILPITLEIYDIRALQANRKTVLHLPYELSFSTEVQPGDLLWVRESCFISKRNFAESGKATHSDGRVVAYQAKMDVDGFSLAEDFGVKRTPGLKMPRFASRYTLVIDAVSKVSLDNITEQEARKAGIWFDGSHFRGGRHAVRGTLNRHATALDAFRAEWSSMHINTDYSMHRNPLILRLAFTPVAQNVDEYLASIDVMQSPAPGVA